MKKRAAPAKPAKARDKAGRLTRARETPAPKPAPVPPPPAAAVKPHKPTDAEKAKLSSELSKMLLGNKQARALELAKSKPDRTIPAGDGDSDIEARIIESLGNPIHRPLTIEQRCELIGIGRATWYRHFGNPTFHSRASRAWRECCREQLGLVYEVLIDSALIIGRDGHRDRKLLLEILGEVEAGRISGQGEVSKDGQEMSDDELLAAFEGREELIPAGVLRRLGKDPDAASDVKSKPKPHTIKEARNAKAGDTPKANKARRAR